MTASSNCFVIAIAGPSGAGKTTAIRSVAARLGDAAALFFDDYESSSVYPNITQWLADGGDPNQFQTPRLCADLRALRAGAAIAHPESGEAIQPARLIVLEEPFGRTRDEIASLIDFVVCVDLPLEIALARKLHRMLGFFLANQTAEAFAKHLDFFLPWYLDSGRELYHQVQQQVLQRCDFVANGMLPPDALAASIADAIRARLDHNAR